MDREHRSVIFKVGPTDPLASQSSNFIYSKSRKIPLETRTVPLLKSIKPLY
jgi:hypothetical protein